MRVSVVDKLEIADRRVTTDGYLAVRANIARSGVYQYSRAEVGLPGNPNEMVGVYRSPEFVFDDASLATIPHKPITLNHPKGGVSAKTWKRDAIGHMGGAAWESEDRKHVVVDMLMMDSVGIQAANTTHQQISLGYSTTIIAQDGVSPEGEPYAAVMTDGYRVDHAALVPAGRAGHTCRVGDSAWPTEDITDSPATAEKWLRKAIALHEKHMNGTAPTTGKAGAASQELMMTQMKNALSELTGEKVKPKMKMGDTTTHTETLVKDAKKMPSLILDGLKVDLEDSEAVSAAFKKLTDKADAATALADKATADLAASEAKAATDIAAKDAKIATLDAEVASLKQAVIDAKVTPEQMREAAKAYSIITDAATKMGFKVEDAMSEAEIKKGAVLAKLGDTYKDKSEAFFDAAFEIEAGKLKDAAPADPYRLAMGDRKTPDFGGNAAEEARKARQEMIDRLNNPTTEEAK